MTELFPLPFDKPLKGPGAVRTWCGSICAGVVCSALNWIEQGTGRSEKGSCVPDAWTEDKRPVEIKSVSLKNNKGKSVIYKFRIEKEQSTFPNLLYAFVGHEPLGNPSTLGLLHHRLSETLLTVILVPSCIVHAAALSTQLRKIKLWKGGEKVGYNRLGYIDGYYSVSVDEWFSAKGRRSEHKTVYEQKEFKLQVMQYPTIP